ncbi:MAG: hypothetical protein V3T80_01770 [Kiloniellales bacterium]
MEAVSLPDGVELEALEVGLGDATDRRDGTDRHGRMFRDREFDICEQSLASYIISKSRGESFTAAPVFPRRLFSQNCMLVNVDAGIDKPADLIGKRVGVVSFQTTLCVLAKGDLKLEYGVPWEEIHWFVQRYEELPWETPEGVSVQNIPEGKDAGRMLVDGELDALFHPIPPEAATARTDRVRRLFPDPRAEATRYFKKYGYCPIMHLMVFPQELIERESWLPEAIMEMWEEAKKKTEAFYEDPSYSLLLFGRNELEAQRETFGADPWPSGLAANRANLERFIAYVADQKLIDAPIPVESLFHESVLDT